MSFEFERFNCAVMFERNFSYLLLNCNYDRVLQEVKVSGPDYNNVNKEEALKDFLLRIKHYQDKYEPLDEFRERNLSFMKIYNTGEKVLVHKHEGHIQARIVYYLMNIHITPRTIYLCRVRRQYFLVKSVF